MNGNLVSMVDPLFQSIAKLFPPLPPSRPPPPATTEWVDWQGNIESRETGSRTTSDIVGGHVRRRPVQDGHYAIPCPLPFVVPSSRRGRDPGERLNADPHRGLALRTLPRTTSPVVDLSTACESQPGAVLSYSRHNLDYQ